MQLGCVRVTERALGRGVVERRERRGGAGDDRRAARRGPAPRDPAFARLVGRVRLVGLAGTVATLAQLDAGDPRLPARRGAPPAPDHARPSSTGATRWPARRPGSASPTRAWWRAARTSCTAGLFVLDAVMERFGVDELLTSENDILDGVAASLVARARPRATCHDGGVRIGMVTTRSSIYSPISLHGRRVVLRTLTEQRLRGLVRGAPAVPRLAA